MKNTPNYEECVKYALEVKGIAGNSFKDTALQAYERHTVCSTNTKTYLPYLKLFRTGSLDGMKENYHFGEI